MDKESYEYIVRHINTRLERYPEGGTREEKWKFFSDLDNSYQTEEIVDPILESIYVPNLILTGSFGAYVTTRLADLHLQKDYILFNGHIREGDPPEILDEHHCGRNIEASPYIQTWMLLDDSNYSGRTRFVLENWMIQNRSHPITSAVVIYNGAPNFHPQVNALYSWYMVHTY
jgi:hypothetical protein